MKLAFLGDSLTAGWLTDGARVWAVRYAPAGALNFGVPGDTTDDVLRRIEAGELARGGASDDTVVVLLVGTNDLGDGRSPEATVRGVAGCVAALRERYAEARILLLGLLPRGDGGPAGYAAVAAVNGRLADLADPTVQFCEIGGSFVDGDGSVRAELYDADRLHLSAAGYQAWSLALEAALGAFYE